MKSSATHQSRICFFHSRQHKVELAPSQISIQYKQQCIEISRHVFARLTLSSVQAQTLLYENQSNTNKKPLEYLDSSSITLALHSKLKQIPSTTNLCSTQLPPSSSKYSNSFVNPRSSSKQARTCFPVSVFRQPKLLSPPIIPVAAELKSEVSLLAIAWVEIAFESNSNLIHTSTENVRFRLFISEPQDALIPEKFPPPKWSSSSKNEIVTKSKDQFVRGQRPQFMDDQIL
jgi:hypothetical protein